MGDLGAAVVGAGFIGPVHVEALRRLGIPVRGILGCDAAESESAKEKLGLPKAYRDLDEVLADGTVQAVHLAVPNVLHYEFAKRALAAGKHVMCEKPLAMNSARVGRAGRSWPARSGSPRACATTSASIPLNLEARDRVRRGDVGQVYAINGSYVQDWLFYDTDYNWRVLADQGGAAAGRGRHRHALDGPGHLDHRPGGRGRVGRPEDGPPGPQAAQGRGRDLHRQDGQAGANRAGGHHHRGLRLHPLPLPGRGPGQPARLAGHCRPQELHPLRDRRLEVRPGLEQRVAQRAVDRPPREAQREPDPRSGAGRATWPGATSTIPAATTRASPTRSSSVSGRSTSTSRPATTRRRRCIPTFAEGHREVVLCEAILKSHREERWVNV